MALLTRPLASGAAVALLALALLTLLPDCAYACSCGPSMFSFPERAKGANSTAVFSGEVIDIEKGPQVSNVTFRVSEVWKGLERGTLEVSTAREGTSCDYYFSEGREYLVYAWGRKMEVGSCGRTTPLSEASADLQALANGETMGGSRVLSDTSGGFPPLGVIGMVGGAVSLVVLMRLVRTG